MRTSPERLTSESDTHHPPDNIWADLVAGRASAMETIVDHYWTRLVAFAAHIVRDRDAAQDIVQEVLARVWQRRAGWRATGSVEALLFRMTRNAAIDHRRHEAHLSEVAMSERRAVASNPADHVETAELERAVDDAIARLPAARRQVFLLVRMTELSYVEIAELLDIAPQTVANHMRLALADLRKALANHI